VDPNENLKEQLRLASSILDYPAQSDMDTLNADSERLAELVLALDEWMFKGGFLPARWGPCKNDGR
jgi:hypothetical protein